MAQFSLFRRRTPVLAAGTALAAGLAAGVLVAPAGGLAGPGHTGIVASVPVNQTPNIMNGTVRAIYDAGTKVIAVGSFTTVQNRNSTTDIIRNYVLAFDKATGVVDNAFVPAVDGEVSAVIPGPSAGTVYLAGKFNTVNGVTRRKVALVNVSNGAVVSSFAPPAINGAVGDVVLVGGRLLIGGIFTLVGGQPRNGLASLNASTGARDDYLTVALTENHNWTPEEDGAKAGVGADKLAASPDGTKLVVIGNFKKANGVLHDQIVKIDLGPTAATIADWNTDRFQPRCAWWAFDTWMRDVAFSPDGAFFVVATTGAAFTGTLCDTASRWEAGATGSNVAPTWVNWSGGDTILSVAVTEQAVYVGGHIRWMNNTYGGDSAGQGAVGRASLAALDLTNGMPLRWNPGRHPRGYGVSELHATPEGLWLGYDTKWMGNFQWRRERIAFLPLAGGYTAHATNVATLPGDVYQAGGPAPTNVLHRVNAGGPLVGALDGGPDWAADTSASPSPYRNGGSNEASFGPVGSVDGTVPATTPSALYTDERWDPGDAPEMHWGFPVTAGTQVEVRLYLANRYDGTSQVGQRVFHVALDGTTVLSNYDIVAAVGHNVGTMRSWVITSDGMVDLDFTHVVENPLVNAIEIVKTGPPPPPGTENNVYVRSYDGNTGVGGQSPVANPDGTAWSTARGAFWAGGTLFYGMNGTLYRRSFNGTAFGTPSVVDPYHDPYWDNVETDSGPAGQTYAGATVSFYGEIASVTGMFYWQGRLYYTLLGQSGLFWRWFTPDSGAVSPERFTAAGSGFGDSGGVFVSGDKLYQVSRSTGNLSRQDWVSGAPAGSPVTVSGPGVDGQDWRARAVFIGP
ncbi:MAG TPA: malectin domain-containing carbohydrate-binding protein [Micromonosporaceae bacterium]|nr:malectin domain-containing carbohydrate-binding protein [Micromonosporaceae bacterium]